VDKVIVECLRCGACRTTAQRDAGECPRCGYVGWAASADIDEPLRRALRDRAVETRRIHAVV
jgi:ssDNA-binding Zn-finger/Zn-ribbon topoisomerase 1